MSQFYSQISYSIGNEDWRSEEKALDIKPDDHVLSVTASGDRPLNLLMRDCRKIVAIDANPLQTALCELKKAALHEFDYEKYLSFLGILPCNHRMEMFEKIEKLLGKESSHIWQVHREKIKKGIIFQGAVEKKLYIVSKIAHLCAGDVIEGLFETRSLNEQCEFLEKNWRSERWRSVFEAVLSPFFRKYVLRDPGLYAFVNIPISPPLYLYQRLERSLFRYPVRENIIASLLFMGKLYKEAYTPYLLEPGYNQIRGRLKKLNSITANVISYLEEAEENSIDCFSLSDIASYMSKDDFKRLIYAVYRTARKGARFCIREFMSSHVIPEDLADVFRRNRPLEKDLEDNERCFVYRFMAGTIEK